MSGSEWSLLREGWDILVAGRLFSYSGQGFSLQGDKGRFVLPPQLRKMVRESSGGTKVLCLAKHDRWNCLTGFGLSRREDFEAQLEREEANALQRGAEFDRDLRAVQLYGFCEVPFDDSGRFVMPDHLIELGRVGDRLFFQGAGAFFTLWNPDELAAMGVGWEGAQAACAGLAGDAVKGRKG